MSCLPFLCRLVPGSFWDENLLKCAEELHQSLAVSGPASAGKDFRAGHAANRHRQGAKQPVQLGIFGSQEIDEYAGIDRDHFVLGLRAHGHREVIPLQKSTDLAGVVHDIAGPGDFVVCLGAGNITQWAYALPGELKALG